MRLNGGLVKNKSSKGVSLLKVPQAVAIASLDMYLVYCKLSIVQGDPQAKCSSQVVGTQARQKVYTSSIPREYARR